MVHLCCLFPLSSSSGPAQSGILSDREVVNLFLHFTVNPKPRVDYIDRPRCCLRGKEYSINRFQQVESRWGYSGTSDRIRYWSSIRGVGRGGTSYPGSAWRNILITALNSCKEMYIDLVDSRTISIQYNSSGVVYMYQPYSIKETQQGEHKMNKLNQSNKVGQVCALEKQASFI